MVGWALLADSLPIYALYALLFADSGLSVAEISLLFVIWSTVGMLAEVPSGAIADRYSRRGSLVAAGLLQAIGYVLWMLLPGFPGFAAGFVIWALGGALVSGAQEALLYDGLAAAGVAAQFARVQGWVGAVGQISQIPAAVSATVLFAAGGYALAGWVSIGLCLAGSLVASRLPEPPRSGSGDGDGDGTDGGYLATLRAGLSEATVSSAVRVAVLAVAVLGGLDALEEYFPLLAEEWSVPVALVPLAVLPVSLAGATGAALAGMGSRLRPGVLALMFGAGALMLGATALVAQPIGLAAVAVFHGIHQMVLIVAEARLQERIEGRARATVTSVAGVSVELVGLGLFVIWAFGGLVLVAALALLIAAALPSWLRQRTA